MSNVLPSISSQTSSVSTIRRPIAIHLLSVPLCTGIPATLEGSHVDVVVGSAVHSPLLNVKPGTGHARSEASSL